MALEYTLRLANQAFVGPVRQAQAALGGLSARADSAGQSVAGVSTRFGGLRAAANSAGSAAGAMATRLTSAGTAAGGLGLAARAAGSGAVFMGSAAAGAAVGVGALMAVAAPILPVLLAIGAVVKGVQALTGAVGKASEMEQLSVRFRTLVGDAGKAESALAQLKALSAQTPLEFPELADAGGMLIAFGESAETVASTLRRVGDVSSGVGAPIKEIAELYGKAKVQGKLMAEELNEFQGRGIPLQQELARIVGVSADEIRGLASEGKITFPLLDQAFRNLTAEGGKFANQMQAKSQTLEGKWSTFNDTVGETLTLIGTPVLDWIKPMLNGAQVAAEAVKNQVAGLSALMTAAGNAARAAWADGQIGQALGHALTLGAKVGINFLLQQFYALPGRIQSIMGSLGGIIGAAVAGDLQKMATIYNNLSNLKLKNGLLDTSPETDFLGNLAKRGGEMKLAQEKAGAGAAPAAGQAAGLADAIKKATAEGAEEGTKKGNAKSAASSNSSGEAQAATGRRKIMGFSESRQNPEAKLYKGLAGFYRLQQRDAVMDNGKSYDKQGTRAFSAFARGGNPLDKIATPALDALKKAKSGGLLKELSDRAAASGLGAVKPAARNLDSPAKMTRRQEREQEAARQAKQQTPRWDLVAQIEGHFRTLAVG